eukprot:5445378-Pyramimonas_sp.AAC.1
MCPHFQCRHTPHTCRGPTGRHPSCVPPAYSHGPVAINGAGISVVESMLIPSGSQVVPRNPAYSGTVWTTPVLDPEQSG